VAHSCILLGHESRKGLVLLDWRDNTGKLKEIHDFQREIMLQS
jgi:hypothetical protein